MYFNLFKRGALSLLATLGVWAASAPAQAATISCFDASSTYTTTVDAVCRSTGVLFTSDTMPDWNDAGVTSSVNGGGGAIYINSYGPTTFTDKGSLVTEKKGELFLDTALATQWYLLLTLETGGGGDTWTILSVYGQDLIDGVFYTESLSATGNAKFRVYADPYNGTDPNPVPVPLPGTLPLAAVGLAAAALRLRRRG